MNLTSLIKFLIKAKIERSSSLLLKHRHSVSGFELCYEASYTGNSKSTPHKL